MLDNIKYTGFHYATRSGLTISLWDALIPDEKPEILAETQAKADQINENFENGLSRAASATTRWSRCGPMPPTRSLRSCSTCSTRRTRST